MLHDEDDECINLSISLSSGNTSYRSVNIVLWPPLRRGVACSSRTVYQGTQCLRVYYQRD
jgi:hypothetical protein